MAAGNDALEKKKPTSLNPGDVIRCRTLLGENYHGEVMGYDESTQAVVIKSQQSKQQSKALFDVSIINLKLVSEGDFELIETFKGELPPLPDLDKEKTDFRLQTARERVGIGVSAEGQQLFDFIRKTIQECHWNGQNIMVLAEVEIQPPYKHCTGHGAQDRTLEYIKMLVSKFYNENGESPAVTT